MRNLQCTKRRSWRFPVESTFTAAAFNLDDVVCSFGPSESNPTISIRRISAEADEGEPGSKLIASWDAATSDKVLDLHCFPDTGTISLIFAGGDIVVVRDDALPGEEQIEIVGSVDAGIVAAAWSPDEELLAVATKADTLLFMTKDYEPTANITLSLDDIKISNHVSVGWGKKETQFKGRGAAKVLRDPTVPEHVDEGTLSPLDDGSVSISWRGDGQYVAVNSILDTESKRRIVRVYTREGVLESVSEPVNGLEGALSWKPSGQILAGVRRREDGADVVFFERNGLRHGEFDLRLSKEEAESVGRSVSLNWNVDSSVLAVMLADRLQLWIMGNYHWYLKQEILFTPGDTMTNGLVAVGPDNPPAGLAQWHPERPLQLLCSDGEQLRLLSYSFAVARGSVVPPNDLGLVAVIDGKRLKITPLRTANVPPPMAFEEIELHAPANSVRFNSDGTQFTVVQADGHQAIFDCDYAARPTKRATPTKGTPSGPEASVGSLVEAPEGECDFTLSDTGVLRHGAGLRLPGCTSFVVTQDHLIYTTSNHLLKFVHLQASGELQIPLDEPEKDERCRSIERGAKIVTVMPSAYSLVLQMPRGNLETIYPRALVLAGIRRSIDARDYKKAFSICRTQRVDMNILHDYAPEQFMNDVERFVKQVKRVEHMDLFLSSLSEENVAETIYRNTLAPQSKATLTNGLITNGHSDAAREPATSASKINKICDAFLATLRDQTSSLQNVVTAHVCKSPPDLEAGLQLVSELRKQQKQEKLESAVEHICFLADVNQLYDAALGLYDLDVALLIAQQSQKDPREYLPYLQSLYDMSPLRQRFSIDNDLKRYPKAIAHLHALDDFDELKNYMVKHELYAAAMELYRYDSAKLSELMRLYGGHLASRSRYTDAGTAYEYVQDYRSACDAYRSAGAWRECLATAALVPLAEEELRALAMDLSVSLEEAKDFSSAATVYLEYLNDLENAARSLCKAFRFSEATRLVALHKRPELLRTVVDAGLIEASAAMTEMLAEMKSQLHSQVPRLRELRQKKAADPMAFWDGGVDAEDGDFPDNISLAPTDASTTGTFMTRYTNRSTGTLATNASRKTSKNRRREERKRARGKKGTVYEEEYLVNSIGRLVKRLNSTCDDVKSLVEGLMRRAMRERAVAVDSVMREVMDVCQSCLAEVYSQPAEADDPASGRQEDAAGQGRPQGGEGVLWEAMDANKQRREVPVLKLFDRFSLL